MKSQYNFFNTGCYHYFILDTLIGLHGCPIVTLLWISLLCNGADRIFMCIFALHKFPFVKCDFIILTIS